MPTSIKLFKSIIRGWTLGRKLLNAGGRQRVVLIHRLKGQNIKQSSCRTNFSANVIYTVLVSECYRSDWSDDSHMSHVTSVRETVSSIQSNSLKYMKKKTLWLYHIKNLSINAVALQQWTVIGFSRTPGSVQEPGLRPGAREESASPAWLATSAKNAHIYFFLSCFICHYIVILCKNIRVDSKFKAIAPMSFRKNNLKLRLV